MGRVVPRLGVRTTLRWIACAAFLVSVASRVVAFHHYQSGEITGGVWEWVTTTVTHYRLDGLASGVIVATWPPPRSGRLPGLVTLVAFATVLVFTVARLGEAFESQRGAILAVLFGMVVHGSTGEGAWARLRLPGARLVADLSYSTYLTHPIAEKVVMRILPSASAFLKVAALCMLAVVLATLLRALVEVPFLKLRDRRGAPSAKTPVRLGPVPIKHADR